MRFWPSWIGTQVPTTTATSTPPAEDTLGRVLYNMDFNEPEPKAWYWGRDYGRDLLADINQLAHYRGTMSLTRDCLQRAHREIRRLRRIAGET